MYSIDICTFCLQLVYSLKGKTPAGFQICLEHYADEFAFLACECTSVVCCRCSPEQKAQIVLMLAKLLPERRIAAVGDGGNDVSMIQAAHAGIGIVGKVYHRCLLLIFSK